MTQQQTLRLLLADLFSIVVPYADDDPRFWLFVATGFGYTGTAAILFAEALELGGSGGGGGGGATVMSWLPSTLGVVENATRIEISGDLGEANGLLSVTFPQVHMSQGVQLNLLPDLQTISFPNLVSTAGDAQSSNALDINLGNLPSLTELSFPLFQTGGGSIVVTHTPLLSSINLPNFTGWPDNAGYFASLLLYDNPVGGLQSISLPLLTAIPGDWIYNSNVALTSVFAPLLASVGSALGGFGAIRAPDNVSLTEIYYPSLVSVFGNVDYDNCISLVEVSFPLWLPTNGTEIRFDVCALEEASVDHILARCVANAAFLSGTVNLDGGTNAPPSIAGNADKATLIARGVTVTTN